MKEVKKMKDEISENEKTKRLAGNAFYKSKKTPKSQMIMLKLLQANRSNPLQKANKMSALAYFIRPDSEGLDIDYELVDVIFSVSNSLLNTKKTVSYYKRYPYDHYPIPWSFQFNLETFKKYIEPWMAVYHYYKEVCPQYTEYTVEKTMVWCPYCEELIFRMNKATKKELIEQFKISFSDLLETKKEILIDDAELNLRKLKYVESKYVPPYWEATYVKCPECDKRIRVAFTFFKGTDYSRYDPILTPPKFETLEPIIEDRTITDPILKVLQYKNASYQLSELGYEKQITSFLQWAEPHVSRIEYEILKLVDENVLEKYLDQLFQTNQDQTQGVEQN